jgi:hypothetical protein
MDETVNTAIRAFSDQNPVLGGVIILLLAANVVTARFLIGIIRELKADLVTERAEHQKTRMSQIDDLRNHGRLAESVDALRDTLVRKA